MPVSELREILGASLRRKTVQGFFIQSRRSSGWQPWWECRCGCCPQSPFGAALAQSKGHLRKMLHHGGRYAILAA